MKPAVSVLFLVVCLISAQTPPAPPATPPVIGADLPALIKQQFGATFALQPKFPTPIITLPIVSEAIREMAVSTGREGKRVVLVDLADGALGALFGTKEPGIRGVGIVGRLTDIAA